MCSCWLTPELSWADEWPRRWDDHSASAEAAKRTRLERIVRSAMKVHRCSVYKIRGAQPPSGVTRVQLPNSDDFFVVSDSLDHIDPAFFRADALPNLVLSGVFGQAREPLTAELLDARVVEKQEALFSSIGRACYLTVLTQAQDKEPLPEQNRKVGPYIVAVLNARPPAEWQAKHQQNIDAAISALALTHRNFDRAEKIIEATYRTTASGETAYYCQFSGVGRARVISQISPDFSREFETTAAKIASNPDLTSVFRLASASYIQSADRLAAFLAAWSALEIFTHKAFPRQERELFSPLETSHSKFVAQVRTVMKEKYRLADKFSLITSTLSAVTSEKDLALFKSLKLTRDQALHGGVVSPDGLPLEATQQLLERYLTIYINAQQT